MSPTGRQWSQHFALTKQFCAHEATISTTTQEIVKRGQFNQDKSIYYRPLWQWKTFPCGISVHKTRLTHCCLFPRTTVPRQLQIPSFRFLPFYSAQSVSDFVCPICYSFVGAFGNKSHTALMLFHPKFPDSTNFIAVHFRLTASQEALQPII
jgi:hypothetical protein